MAFDNLTFTGLIWQPLGLKHILLPCIPQKGSQPANANIKKISARQISSAPIANIEKRAPSTHLAQEELAAPTQGTKQQTDRWQPIPKEKWPQIWIDQLKDTRRAKLAWTYWHLGSDLLSLRGMRNPNGDEARQRNERFAFLKKLLKELGYPPALHTFWPVNLPIEDTQETNPDLFWSGLYEIGARGTIIMGSNATRAVLNKPQLKPLTHFLEKGIRIWILWDIDTFARKPENYQSILAFLRKALAPFSTL